MLVTVAFRLAALLIASITAISTIAWSCQSITVNPNAFAAHPPTPATVPHSATTSLIVATPAPNLVHIPVIDFMLLNVETTLTDTEDPVVALAEATVNNIGTAGKPIPEALAHHAPLLLSIVILGSVIGLLASSRQVKTRRPILPYSVIEVRLCRSAERLILTLS
jgi:hypothetical protein